MKKANRGGAHQCLDSGEEVLVNARNYDINQPLEIQPELIFAARNGLAVADKVDVKAGFTID
jgi:hypothetical protein